MIYSVIIPVYNAEKTLHRCVESLIKQNYTNAEIILVNDGSKDRSDEICREYVLKYDYVKYIYQPNSGVSAARNTGIDAATGEYILFIDSDDYVNKNYFSIMDIHLSQSAPDLLLFSTENPSHAVLKDFYITNDLDIAKKANFLLTKQQLYSVWNKVFKKSIIEKHHIRFPDTLSISEDAVFVITYLTHTKSFASIMNSLYVHDMSDIASLSRKKRDYVFEHLQKAVGIMYESVNHSLWSENAKKILRRGIVYLDYRSVYSASKELYKFHNLTAQFRRREIKKYCDYITQKHLCPHNIICLLLAIPIHLRWVTMIDIMMKLADWRRKKR